MTSSLPPPTKTHCHFCGQRLIKRYFEGRERLYCPACRQPNYENPVPATCLLVVDHCQRLLLVQRSVAPKIGHWCLPGGFMELGESPEFAALRELEEETGLQGTIRRLLGVRTAPSAQYHSILMLCFLVREYTGDPVAGDDASQVRWFDRAALPAVAFDSHIHFITNYFSYLQK